MNENIILILVTELIMTVLMVLVKIMMFLISISAVYMQILKFILYRKNNDELYEIQRRCKL